MGKDDGEKTVFGGKLPPPGSSPQRESPFSAPVGGARPAAPGGDDRTVIGGALPPVTPGRVAPADGFRSTTPSGGDTWLGGPLPQNSPSATIGTPNAQSQGFFPEIPSRQPVVEQRQTPRISLDRALRATGLGKGGSSNPLIAAAANLLILFGRLRTGMVEMDAMPLMDHVTREIDLFERNAIAAGVDPHEALVAKYALCGTADDIVQNLPGADRGVWIQYSMVARFFQKRDSGVGFFQEAEKAMQAPGQRYYLLDLMLTCLSLGFEGQYRTLPNGAVELARIRRAIYETLRRVKPRPDEDMSVNWLPVLLGGRRRFGTIPIWAIMGVAALILVGFFAVLSTLLNRDGAEVATKLNLLHPTAVKIALERTPGAIYQASSTQLERIQDRLAKEIGDGLVSVGTKGDYIYIRVGNLLLFDSGKAVVKDDFAPLATRIVETLNEEADDVPILILGFTDTIPLKGTGLYKTNLDLSIARAQGVHDVLAGLIKNPDRATVEGRGEADPIGDNATAEGRALNRRVEIMVGREGTY